MFVMDLSSHSHVFNCSCSFGFNSSLFLFVLAFLSLFVFFKCTVYLKDKGNLIVDVNDSSCLFDIVLSKTNMVLKNDLLKPKTYKHI